MLPYRLRPPRFGHVEENRKRRSDGTAQANCLGGGPVQQALQKDLRALAEHVLQVWDRDFDDVTNDNKKSRHRHNKSCHHPKGKAFQSFKQVFGSHKIALLHQLLPHPSADKQSYAQLIYAACLENFQQSMKEAKQLRQNEESTDAETKTSAAFSQSVVAIFSLYALYGTNPLLRPETMAPLDYLPLGLVDRDDPKRLVRRAYRQPIRIDRHHFGRILQFVEDCRHHQARCGMRKDMSCRCTCSLARDALEVLERLAPLWDCCEYTGPISLEGLAGHGDYTAMLEQGTAKKSKLKKKIKKNKTKKQAETSEEEEEEEIHEAVSSKLEGSDKIAQRMEDYQKSIQSMILAPTKSLSVTQLRATLAPVLPQPGKSSWRHIGQELRQGRRIGSNTQTLANDLPEFIVDDQIPPETEVRSETAKNVEDEAPGTQDSKLGVNLACSTEIGSSMQAHLQTSWKDLVGRYGIEVFQPRQSEEDILIDGSVYDEGDVSTLGYGGISIATGQGQRALKALLGEANPDSRVPKQVSAKPSAQHLRIPQHATATTFLTSDLTATLDDGGESAHGLSDVSLESYSDLEDDDASIATSAAGKRALDALLSKVSNTKAPSSARRGQKRKRAPVQKRDAEDLPSVASASVGPGERALQRLLKKAKRKPAPTQVKTPRKSRPPKTSRTENDVNSLSSSVGPGGAALEKLMQASKGASSNKPKRSPRKRAAKGPKVAPNHSAPTRMLPARSRSKRASKTPQDDVSSVGESVSVGHGHLALTSLLARADTKESQQPREPNDDDDDDDDDQGSMEEDHQTLASSIGPGTRALTALLKNAVKE